MGDYFKTILLLGLLSVLIVFIGGFIGGRGGLYIALIISLVMNIGAYFFSDKIALSSNGAEEVTRQEVPRLYSIVEELAQKMNIPMPRIYITPVPQANAFATGRDPNHAAVAVTQGLMNLLSDDEIKGVLAHELSHVKNRDILISTIAAVLASTVSFLAQMGMYGGYTNNNDRERNVGGLGILLAFLAPLGASIIQLAVSRDREYEADETGAETLRDGKPLATALLKIEQSATRMPLTDANPAFSSLYISNPFGNINNGVLQLFATHPPTDERIRRLLAMHFS